MKKLFITTAATLLLASSYGANAQKVCQDDPRLYTVKSVLNDIKSGKAVEPLKLTPATYLSLTANTRTAIGDNISVLDGNCIPVPVVNGEPARKLAIPYENLAVELQHSAIREDKEGFMRLIRLFRAQPKASSSIISIIAPLNWPENATNWARKIGVLSANPQHGASQHESSRLESKCHTLAAHNTHVELFALLGGTVSDKETVLSHLERSSYEGIYFADTNGSYLSTRGSSQSNPAGTDTTCRSLNYNAIVSSFAAINMPAITNGNGSSSPSRHSKMEEWLKNQFPKTNKDKTN